MERKRHFNQFIIAREVTIETEEGEHVSREIVAEIPARSGTYETEQGELEVAVFKPSKKDNTRKVIFSGSIVASEGKRRVVNFPASPKKEVKQPYGSGEFLVFSQKQHRRKSK